MKSPRISTLSSKALVVICLLLCASTFARPKSTPTPRARTGASWELAPEKLIQRDTLARERAKTKQRLGRTVYDSVALLLSHDADIPAPRQKARVFKFRMDEAKMLQRMKEHPSEPIAQSIENIEQYSFNAAKTLRETGNSRLRTEVMGETVALAYLLRDAKAVKGLRLAYAVAPGHGTGFDQLWFEGPAERPTKLVIVEAKGPGAVLSKTAFQTDQMSLAWVQQKIHEMRGPRVDSNKRAWGDRLFLALYAKQQSLIPKGQVAPEQPVWLTHCEVVGFVLTARDPRGDYLTATRSHNRNYTEELGRLLSP